MAHTFGDVRALIHHPSPENWQKLISMLCDWPDAPELREVVLPYCEQALEAWPDLWRHAGAFWVERAFQDLEVVHPGVKLARSLCLGPRQKKGPSWVKLWDHYDLSAITSLQLCGDGAKSMFPRKDITRFVEHLEGTPLRALRLLNLKLKPAQWQQMMAWSGLERLETLALDCCRLTPFTPGEQDDTSLAMLTSRPLSALRHLSVRDNKLRAPDVTLLAEAPFAAQLRTFRYGAIPSTPYRADHHVWFNRVEREGMEALCQSGAFSALESLELSYQLLDKQMLAPLLEAQFDSLKSLDLHQNYLKSSEGKALARAPFIRRLESLDLSGNPIGAQATTVLCDVFEGSALRKLHLNHAKIGSSGAAYMMCSEGLAQLEHLGFADNELHGDDLKVFANSALHRLTHLNVMRNTMTDDTYADFMRAPFLGSLETLKIPSLSDEQVVELLEHPDLQQLEHLSVDSRRDPRNQALAAHPHGHKLTFLREHLYHYLNYTPLFVPLPGLHDAAPR